DVDSAINYEGLIPLDPYLFSAETFNELTDDVADLTAANGELTGQLAAANEQIAELLSFYFMKNVKCVLQENDTNFGKSEAFIIKSISVNGSGVSVNKAMFRDEESLNKNVFEVNHEIITDRDVIDFIYKKYITLHNIPEENLIIEE
ncbi:MAG: hypothetical protein AB9882_01550, partial [Ignavibacteriaceae bacterium]